MARTAFWTDALRPLGVPLPEILARDLTSLFPSLVSYLAAQQQSH